MTRFMIPTGPPNVTHVITSRTNTITPATIPPTAPGLRPELVLLLLFWLLPVGGAVVGATEGKGVGLDVGDKSVTAGACTVTVIPKVCCSAWVTEAMLVELCSVLVILDAVTPVGGLTSWAVYTTLTPVASRLRRICSLRRPTGVTLTMATAVFAGKTAVRAAMKDDRNESESPVTP